jgi:hypothetical protein
MAFEVIDLVTSILVLIVGFSLFTGLVADYRTVSTVSRLMRKRIKVNQRSSMVIPVPLSIGELSISKVEPLDEVKVSVDNSMIKVDNITMNREIRITIHMTVVGRIGDYPVRGKIILYT